MTLFPKNVRIQLPIHVALYTRRKKSAHHCQDPSVLIKICSVVFLNRHSASAVLSRVTTWCASRVLPSSCKYSKLLHLLRHMLFIFGLVLLVRWDVLWYHSVWWVVEVPQWCMHVVLCIFWGQMSCMSSQAICGIHFILFVTFLCQKCNNMMYLAPHAPPFWICLYKH